jgi:hypothetical protein
MLSNTPTPVIKTRHSLIVAAITALLIVVLVTPASAADDPPPVPGEGWLTFTADRVFTNINPCTGLEHTTFVSRVVYLKPVFDDGPSSFFTRTYTMQTSTDGWDTNGWVHAVTHHRMLPGGNFLVHNEWVIPLHRNPGEGVYFIRDRHQTLILADGTVVMDDNPPFEVWCAGGTA